jgi:hypothetical protein
MSELVSVSQLADFLRMTFDLTQATAAQMMLDGAEELAREYCGWHIAPSRTETLTVDGANGPFQPLPTLGLAALTAVTEEGYTLDVTGIDWSTYGLLTKRTGGYWTPRRRGVVATITHGLATPPPWLVTLICGVAGRAMQTPLGIVQETGGAEAVTYAQPAPGGAGTIMLHPGERRMLDRLALPGRP